jgi:cysteine sulfinate desulfinase/cysteine desulfurase-like protein
VNRRGVMTLRCEVFPVVIILGRDTTEADIDWTAMVLKQVLQRLTPDLSLVN